MILRSDSVRASLHFGQIPAGAYEAALQRKIFVLRALNPFSSLPSERNQVIKGGQRWNTEHLRGSGQPVASTM